MVQGEPEYVSTDPVSGRVDFVWSTSAACPQYIDVGSNCQVTDLLSGFTYDVSSLRNTSADYAYGLHHEMIASLLRH